MLLGSFVLSKEDFGIISWANATSVFITTLLTFGMEQVVARRIATSSSSDWSAIAFLLHNLVGSIVSLLLIIMITLLAGDGNAALAYLPVFFGAQALMLLVMPLKQCLNAKHMFAPYGIIAAISNFVKNTFRSSSCTS